MADIPKIRFKGFTEPWEQRKLGDIATFINGRAYSQEELLSSGKYKVLRVGNFYTNDSWYYSDLELDDKYYAEEGDLLYTWSATFGPHIWRGDKVIYHYHIWKVELSEHLEKRFAVQLLEQDKATILSDKNGSTMVHITKAGMEEKIVLIPKNVNEQAKIGAYLDELDNLITLHQRKCDDTKELKKYMLQKMFPKNGEKFPEIRFKGFTEAWEQRKLGEICSRVQGNDGRMELPTLTISAANGWMKQEDRFSGNIAGKEQKNYTLLHKGELSYNHGNSKLAKYGTVFSLQTYEEALVPRVYHSFKVEIGSADFIEYYFATKMPDRELRKLISSGARMDGLLNIGYDDFMGIKMMFPSVLEQDKIAEYFRAFDHLITLHQRKCDTLKELKKYMLQNMFPKKG